MEIKELQEKACKVIEERLAKKQIKSNIDLTLIHLIEEFGEIASQVNNGKLKRREVNIKNIGEEISDCIILRMMLSKQYNIDIEKELINKIEEVRNKKN